MSDLIEKLEAAKEGSDAPYPALALCIAALKARDQSSDQAGKSEGLRK